MNQAPPCPQYLRAQITLPKLTGVDFFKTRAHRLAYEQLLGTVWRELLKRQQDPIKVIEAPASRRVEVLGLVRYYVNHRTQQVSCRVKQCLRQENGWHFNFKLAPFVMVDPPFYLNKNIVGNFVDLWITNIDHLAGLHFAENKEDLNLELIDCVNTIQIQLRQSIYTALCTSSNWKNLRKAIFNALALDPEVVKLSRLSSLTSKVRSLTELNFNHVCRHLEAYRQIYSDAPNLLWLYSIAIDEGILNKVSTNPIADLKQAMLDHHCSQRAWRVLAKAKQRNFDEVITCNNKRWHYLVEFLRLHERLDRSQVISPRLLYLFDNPFWHLPIDNNLIIYRGAEFQPAIFNKFIDESQRHKTLEQSAAFAEDEAASVLTWIAQTKIKFDANQQRQPWVWFASKAADWFLEQLAFDQLSSLSWECGLSESDYDGYRFTPLITAWEVRVEAIKQRHCADQYIERCIGGTYRLFRIQDLKSKANYTLGLRLYDEWEVDQVKGFANRPVADKLRWLCQVIANGLDLIEEGALKAFKDQERLQTTRLKYQRPEDSRLRRWSNPLD